MMLLNQQDRRKAVIWVDVEMLGQIVSVIDRSPDIHIIGSVSWGRREPSGPVNCRLPIHR